MGPRPALWGAALTATIVLAASACTSQAESADLEANDIAATTPTTTATTTTTAALPPCPLDITASITTTASTVEIPGRTEPGYHASVTVPTQVDLPLATDATFSYTASNYAVGTTPNAVVVRVDGPNCVPVERGVEIIRKAPPTTTKPKAKKKSVDCGPGWYWEPLPWLPDGGECLPTDEGLAELDY